MLVYDRLIIHDPLYMMLDSLVKESYLSLEGAKYQLSNFVVPELLRLRSFLVNSREFMRSMINHCWTL